MTGHSAAATRRSVVLAIGLAPVVALASCGSDVAPAPSGADTTSAFEARAQAVADHFRTSEAARVWSTGFVPLDPLTIESGYPDDLSKIAFSEGRIGPPPDWPAGPATTTLTFADGKALDAPVLSAEATYSTFFADHGAPGCPPASPAACEIRFSGVRLGETDIMTTRGTVTVPAWEFSLPGAPGPVSRVAVEAAAPTIDPLPLPDPSLGEPSLTGLEGLDRPATGTEITVLAGHGACDTDLRGHVWESDDVIVIAASVRPPAPDTVCTDQLLIDPVVVTVGTPPGIRPILDAADGQPLLVQRRM